MTLKELMKIAADHAKQMLVGTKDEYMTQFTLVKPNDHFDICATPWRNDKEKRELVLAVCMQALREDAVAYSWCTEAWFATSSFEGEKAPPPIGLAPRDRPDRKEGIVTIASNGKERLFCCYEIIRSKEGNCSELREMEKAAGFQSWITDALDRVILLNSVMDKNDPLRKKLKSFLP